MTDPHREFAAPSPIVNHAIQPASRITMAGVRRGARDSVGVTIAVIAFGIGFGAAAIDAGVSMAVALGISATVFAGASQYASLEMLASPIAWVGLLITVFAVNARHIAMGATLAPWLGGSRKWQKYLTLALLSDASWAATQRAIGDGEHDLGHLLGGGIILWCGWVAGTTIGVLAGQALGAPEQWGLDAILPSFFAVTLVTMAAKGGHLAPWMVAAAAAAAAMLLIPSPFAVIAGAVAGATFGTVRGAG